MLTASQLNHIQAPESSHLTHEVVVSILEAKVAEYRTTG